MLATQTEVSDGTLNIINVGIEFFEQDDISVFLDQADLPLVEGVDYVWSAATTIQFLDTVNSPGGLVPNGVEVQLRRQTKLDSAYNIYDGGAPFSRLTLDENFRQMLFLAQESDEGLGTTGFSQNLNMHGYKIVNLAAGTALTDAVNFGQLNKVLRVPEDIPMLPSAPARAGFALGFDVVGNPAMLPVGSGSGAALALALLNSVDNQQGASLVAYNPSLTYNAGSVGAGIRAAADSVAPAVAAHNVSGAAHADIRALITTNKSVLDATRFDVQHVNNISPVIDLHWGTQCGVGWKTGEPGNNLTTLTTASASAGALSLTVASTTGFQDGMLVTYQGTDTYRYTAVVSQITSGTSLRLDRGLAIGVPSGAIVGNFYRDDAHGNNEGFFAVADDALRQLTRRIPQRAVTFSGDSHWSAVGAGVLSAVSGSLYTNPGASPDGYRSVLVTSASPGGGCRSAPAALLDGDYEVVVNVNVGERTGAFSGGVDVGVEETTRSGLVLTVATRSIGGFSRGTQTVRLPFSGAVGSTYRIVCTSANSGGYTFSVGDVEFMRLGGNIPDFTTGTHVLFGDSWFTSGAVLHNRLIARLPNATVLSAGIPGNRATQMIARFQTDVVPLNPKFVWIMVGTNDYYADVSVADFNQQIHQLRTMVLDIGAIPIMFNAAVGAIVPTLPLPDQLVKSRAYAQQVTYMTGTPVPEGPGQETRSANWQGTLTIAAGATTVIASIPGSTRFPAMCRYFASDQAALRLGGAYGTAVGSLAGAVDTTLLPAAQIVKNTLFPRANVTPRMLILHLNNPTGSPVTVNYTVDASWFHTD